MQALLNIRESLTLEKGPRAIVIDRVSPGNMRHALRVIIDRRLGPEGGRLSIDESKAVLLQPLLLFG